MGTNTNGKKERKKKYITCQCKHKVSQVWSALETSTWPSPNTRGLPSAITLASPVETKGRQTKMSGLIAAAQWLAGDSFQLSANATCQPHAQCLEEVLN